MKPTIYLPSGQAQRLIPLTPCSQMLPVFARSLKPVANDGWGRRAEGCPKGDAICQVLSA